VFPIQASSSGATSRSLTQADSIGLKEVVALVIGKGKKQETQTVVLAGLEVKTLQERGFSRTKKSALKS